ELRLVVLGVEPEDELERVFGLARGARRELGNRAFVQAEGRHQLRESRRNLQPRTEHVLVQRAAEPTQALVNEILARETHAFGDAASQATTALELHRAPRREPFEMRLERAEERPGVTAELRGEC